MTTTPDLSYKRDAQGGFLYLLCGDVIKNPGAAAFRLLP